MDGAYTQQELLLLSNFAYIPACLSDKPVGEIINSYRDPSGGFTPESVYPAAAGGGMDLDDVCTVFSEMDKRIGKNPAFGEISVARKLDENNVRALCYTDPKDENPVIVFRGTGGTADAWTDNFEGAFYSDTDIQQTANDFVEFECGMYRDIVVTGHSKGGNMAQYVTVKQCDRIKECVSYDGQGFGEKFTGQNDDQIAMASPKIVSISAYNDFVNILLASIAGTTIYVANESSAAAAHSSVTLLTCNSFDENGDFVTVRPQGAVSGVLEHLTDILCRGMDPLTVKGKEEMSLIAGSAISLALTTPQDELPSGCIAPTMGMIGAKLAEHIASTCAVIADELPLVSNSVYFNAVAISSASRTIRQQTGSLRRAKTGVENVRTDMALTISTQIFADRALERIGEELERIAVKLDDLSMKIDGITACYQRAEDEASSLIMAKSGHI